MSGKRGGIGSAGAPRHVSPGGSETVKIFGAWSGATVASRVRPIYTALSVGVGQPVPIAVLHATCAAPAGDVTVTVTGEPDVVLHDDGAGFDQEAGDGVYSGAWTTPAEGHVHVERRRRRRRRARRRGRDSESEPGGR